jgi:serine protease Do
MTQPTNFRAFLYLVAAAVAALQTVPQPAWAAGGCAGEEDLIASLLPMVVNVTTTKYKKNPGANSTQSGQALPDKHFFFGSGFIVDPSGVIVTNKHVTAGGIDFSVVLSDGTRMKAELVTEATAFDVAVLRVHPGKPLPAVRIGDSDHLRIGACVIAIGNPLGLSSTVTTGIVSALDRDIRDTKYDDYIQTDAAINHGNSGGPLFNAVGEVIGINTAIYSPSEEGGSIGIGFAIPVNDAHFVVQHLLAGTPVHPGWLGLSVQQVSPDIADGIGLPRPFGSIVTSVADGGPAAIAGLQPGDVILRFAGKEDTNIRALMRACAMAPLGKSLPVTIWRHGAEQVVKMTLREPPGDIEREKVQMAIAAAPTPVQPTLGLQLALVTDATRAEFKLTPGRQGVVVTGVSNGSEAADRGLQPGVIILRVNDDLVTSPDEVQERLEQARGQKRPYVLLLVEYENKVLWVPLRMGL